MRGTAAAPAQATTTALAASPTLAHTERASSTAAAAVAGETTGDTGGAASCPSPSSGVPGADPGPVLLQKDPAGLQATSAGGPLPGSFRSASPATSTQPLNPSAASNAELPALPVCRPAALSAEAQAQPEVLLQSDEPRVSPAAGPAASGENRRSRGMGSEATSSFKCSTGSQEPAGMDANADVGTNASTGAGSRLGGSAQRTGPSAGRTTTPSSGSAVAGAAASTAGGAASGSTSTEGRAIRAASNGPPSPRSRALDHHLTLRRAAARAQWAALTGRSEAPASAPTAPRADAAGARSDPGAPSRGAMRGSGAPSPFTATAARASVAEETEGGTPVASGAGAALWPEEQGAVAAAASAPPVIATGGTSPARGLAAAAPALQGVASPRSDSAGDQALSRPTGATPSGYRVPAAGAGGVVAPQRPSATAAVAAAVTSVRGTPAAVSSAAIAPPAPPAARIPKGLMPLTLQGRMALMDAALELRRASATRLGGSASGTVKAQSAGAAPGRGIAAQAVRTGGAARTGDAGRHDPAAQMATELRTQPKSERAAGAALQPRQEPVARVDRTETTATAIRAKNEVVDKEGKDPSSILAAPRGGVHPDRDGGQTAPAAADRPGRAAAAAPVQDPAAGDTLPSAAAAQHRVGHAADVPAPAAPRATASGAAGSVAAGPARSSSPSRTAAALVGGPAAAAAVAAVVPPTLTVNDVLAAESGIPHEGQGAASSVPSPAATNTSLAALQLPPAPGTARARPPVSDTDTPAVPQLPLGVAAAVEMFRKLVKYMPEGREDGPALLAPHVRYQRAAFQAAAEAAAAHPQAVLQSFDVRHLSTILAAYAAARHIHQPFLRVLCNAAYEGVAASPPLTPPPSASSRTQSGSAGMKARGGPTAAPAAATGSGKPLTFRTACIMLTALARLGYRDPRLVSELGRWLARSLRSGAVAPRTKWRGSWFASSLWAYATLERMAGGGADGGGAAAAAVGASTGGYGAGRSPAERAVGVVASGTAVASAAQASALDVTIAGAAFFTEAAEAVTSAPGWIQLLDCREALWALWAFRVAAAAYGASEGGVPGEGAAAAAISAVPYTADPLVELKLAERAATQMDMLDPGQLAEAYAVVAEAGFGADRDFLAALRRCTLARAHAARPQPLTVMVAALAVLQVQDVVWLSELAAACRKKMINMHPEEIVVVLHAFGAALRFYYMPLFKGAAVMCTVPGLDRLQGMGAGDVVRLVAAFAAVGHYDGLLVRKAAARILALGASATSWQRASVLQAAARLGYRSNSLLRAVTSEVLGIAPPAAAAGGDAAAGSSAASTGSAVQSVTLVGTVGATTATAARTPPALLASVAAACGQMQCRPPGLLPALHAARAREWPRLGLAQRAALCWALLVLTGGLDGSPAGGGLSDAGSSESLRMEPAKDVSTGDAWMEDQAAVVYRGGADAGGRKAAAKDTAAEGRSPQGGGAELGPSKALAHPQQPPDQQQMRYRPAEQKRLLAGVLVDYVKTLAKTPGRQWPGPDNHHHAQLLLACHVLTWHEPELQEGVQGDPRVSTDYADHRRQDGCGGGGLAADEQRALLAELQQLPGGVLRRVLASQRRSREVAHQPWVVEVAALLRGMLLDLGSGVGNGDEDVADAASSGGGGSRRDESSVSGGEAVSSWLPAGMKLVGGRVAEGLPLCDGALGVDLSLELDLELGQDLELGLSWGSSSLPRSDAGQGLEQRAHWQAGQRVMVRFAIELCAVEPAASAAAGGAAAAGAVASSGGNGSAAASGFSGGGGSNSVVRNSAWCLSGSGTLRRRLLRLLGWQVVVLREREWWDFRSPWQQRRGLEALLRRALRQVDAVRKSGPKVEEGATALG